MKTQPAGPGPAEPDRSVVELVEKLMDELDEVAAHGVATNPRCTGPWVSSRLSGALDAHRDLDVVLAMLNREFMDYDVLKYGESEVGSPPQRYGLAGSDGPRYGRPYLNYLKILAALSTVVDRAPKRYVELGGGFGVLGELLWQHEENSSYVNIDIPPLIAVAQWYLSAIGAEREVIGPVDGPVPSADDPRLMSGVTATLPSWRFPEIPAGVADAFVNSFSFQEMEPTTVAAYADLVSSIEPEYVVSLNSRVRSARSVGLPPSRPDRTYEFHNGVTA